MKDYLGYYFYMGMLLIIRDVGNQLGAAVPGVPEGYEIVLEPVEGDSFRRHGGPLDGSTVTTHEEVLAAGDVIVPKLTAIIKGVLESLVE